MKAYLAYKDSGIEWLGNIPVGWNTTKLKYLAELKSGESITSTDIDKTGKFPVYGGNGIRGYAEKYTNNGHFILIGRQGALCGNIHYAEGYFWASEHAIIVYMKTAYEIFWLGELLRIMNLNQYSVAAAQPGLAVETVKNLTIPFPPLPEQRTIAAFLDHKTRLIDTYITKKQQQIERLQVYRTTLINQAVTKGLNPDVPMKDSGIEWLGEIPAHWGTPHLKFLCSLLKDGTHQPPKRQETGIPLLSVRNIVNGRFINLPDDSLISVDDYEKLKRAFEVKENDVLLAIVGATLGKVAIVQEMSSFAIQRSLAIFRPIPSLLHFKYLAYFFKTSLFQQLLWQNVGFSAQPGIYLGTLGNFHCVLPPVKEQHAINVYLDEQTAKIDTLIATTQHQIERLQAYRTALISDAVTGKIDVRMNNYKDYT